MPDRAANAVLLVKAIEEADRAGALLPIGDRAHASRETLRELGLTGEQLRADATGRALKLATRRRAERMLPPLQRKFPVLSDLLAHASWPEWFTAVVLCLALAAGFAAAALGGSRRIDILAVPFLGLVAWNLLVYVLLAADALRRLGAAPGARTSNAGRMLSRWLARTLRAIARRTSGVHESLGRAVSAFAADWSDQAMPLLGQRLRRLLHIAAAALAIGMLAGLYLRGVVLRYEAGWESTFLSAEQVHRVLSVVYSIPSAITGVTLPRTSVEAEALRWGLDGHGANAGPWIHLLAASLVLYVVVPRILLALVATWKLARLRGAAWPSPLAQYARRLFGATARGSAGLFVQVVPYAAGLDAAKLQRLDVLLQDRYGGDVKVEAQPLVAYGEEADAGLRFVPHAGQPFDASVLLFSLASTPETENHGAAIRALRDAAERTADAPQPCVAVDESGMRARFGSDASLAARVDERRGLWRAFVADHGLDAWFVDLGSAAAAPRDVVASA